ncbi:MAG: HIT domain-containing protein, partial [Nanoarchaeota archaeon]
MTTNKDCIFCRIISGEIPAVKIYENQKVTAFLDNNPVKPGHVLVVPKKHNDYVFDLDDAEYTELMLESKKVAKILKNRLQPKKVGLVVEGFGVAHVHVHLIPINKGNELNPEKAKHSDIEELNR